ncbi:hypothetical protein DL766_000477 [Monosporascus sp. MC13-8B]|uniref:FAR1 domain-containing protein n=1 Tax=Monosporascus cannonballus TaxID=155416 RepID=A0ABY0GRL2_9PEZI|nr:hypothetical protein DL762_010424 [Monosporascus cannonballus]RYO89641.1 hypothetical protein DL763_005591 [Monosporascus cannonballus]RYP39219.1 hypothetical protein DL766_000477 [Monosporascus sp. MC13-8B]
MNYEPRFGDPSYILTVQPRLNALTFPLRPLLFPLRQTPFAPNRPSTTATISLPTLPPQTPHHPAIAGLPNGTSPALNSTPRLSAAGGGPGGGAGGGGGGGQPHQVLAAATTPSSSSMGPGASGGGLGGDVMATPTATIATGALAPPPEGIYRTFEDLLTAVQRVAKDQGYGVVKLRASNYRDGKPTRYDLVCDRGGVKYNSTAKKRNPSTRKVDCPWRAKAVCEVQLQNQWRFAVQDARHNHEARVPAAPPGQENTPIAQSIRSLTNKMDRMSHELSQGFGRIETRLEGIEKRLEAMEARINTVEARMSGIEGAGRMEIPMDNQMDIGEGSMLGPAVM